MKIFEINNKDYWLTIIRNFIFSIILFSVALYVYSLFKTLKKENIQFAIFIYLIFLFQQFAIPQIIRKIVIDKNLDQVTFLHYGFFTGSKRAKYSLSEINVALENASFLPQVFGKKQKLIIGLPINKHYSITAKYGFKESAITDIYNELK